MTKKNNLYSNHEASQLRKIRYIGSILLICNDADCPVLEKFRFLDIVAELLYDLFERYWIDLHQSAFKNTFLLELDSIFNQYTFSTRNSIKVFNKTFNQYQIIIDPKNEDWENIFLKKILINSTKIENNKNLISGELYYEFNQSIYHLKEKLFITNKESITLIYPASLLMNKLDRISLYIYYRQRNRDFDSQGYPKALLSYFTKYNTCSPYCLALSTDKPIFKSTYIDHLPVDASFFITWSDLQKINNIPEINLYEKVCTRDPVKFLYHKNDRLLHFPFNNFSEITQLVQNCIDRYDVKEITWTVYRIKKNGMIHLLFHEILKRKIKLTLIIEIKSSYEEINNYELYAEFKSLGAHIIISPFNYKYHAKWALVMLHHNNTATQQDIALLSTGNWNETHARNYLDLTLITASTPIVSDLKQFYSALKRGDDISHLKLSSLWISKANFYTELISIIDNLIKKSHSGKQTSIFLKVNELNFKPIIDKLLEASQAGVKIDACVRSSSLLYSQKNIKVFSILGRFLEHSRIFCFYCENEKPKLYLSSSDLKPKSFKRRLEMAFPIYDGIVRNYLFKLIDLYKNESMSRFIVDKNSSLRYVKGLSLHDYLTKNHKEIE